MKSNKQLSERRTYSSPHIERIQLDNEISLVLTSDADPFGDPTGDPWAKAPEHFNNDPFKTNLG